LITKLYLKVSDDLIPSFKETGNPARHVFPTTPPPSKSEPTTTTTTTTTTTEKSNTEQTTTDETIIRTNEFGLTASESLPTGVDNDNDNEEYCGLNNGVGFILGGQDAKRGAFPFVALLGYRG
jgi:hypothetical protein